MTLEVDGHSDPCT